MKSFGAILKQNQGIGPGFDFLRIALAISIVVFHCFVMTGNVWIRETPLGFFEYALVPMFFALSGFLVTASGLRLSLGNFLMNRGLRIVPALAVDVCLCALVIGPLVTTVSFRDYFTDQKFFAYFLNIVGDIHYALPGVFEKHFNQRVNGALWTVPYEILCYLITSMLIACRWLGDWRKVVAVALLLMGIGIFFEYSGYLPRLSPAMQDFINNFFISRESQIVTAYLCGVVAYQIRDRIPYSIVILAASVAACGVAAFTLTTSPTGNTAERIVLLPALTYITLFIGLTPIKLPKFFKGGDYSYGVYLYHDPLLQVLIEWFPTLSMRGMHGALFVFSLGLPAALVLASCSWRFIERPVLGLRKKFSFVARVREAG